MFSAVDRRCRTRSRRSRRRRVAQFGQAEARAVAGAVLLDRRGSRPPWRAGVLGNGLSPISSSTTSLPLGLQRPGPASTVNAGLGLEVAGQGARVGACGVLSKGVAQDRLSFDAIACASGRTIRGMIFSWTISSPIARWWRNDSRNVPVDARAPVLPDGEIDADLLVGELAGADLEGVRPRLDRQPALEPARLVQGQRHRRLEVDHPPARHVQQPFERRPEPQGLGHELVVVALIAEVEAVHHVQRLAIEAAEAEQMRGDLQDQSRAACRRRPGSPG